MFQMTCSQFVSETINKVWIVFIRQKRWGDLKLDFTDDT